MQIHQQIKQLTTSWLFSSVFPQFVQFARGELVFAEAWGGMGWHGGRNLLQLGNVSAEKKVLSQMKCKFAHVAGAISTAPD